MSEISLITDGSKYSSLIARSLEKKGDNVVILTEPDSTNTSAAGLTEEAQKKQENKELSIVWNKRSPLSARNVILSALNSCSRIDNAVLTYQPGGYNKTFHETSSAVYDLQIDRWIKGYGYLIKELMQLFIKQQHGRLSFILDTDGMKVMTPLENAVYNYLKSLVISLSVLYQNEAAHIYCFESDTSRRDEFLEFFQKTLNDAKYTPGKLHRFGDRKSLFEFNRN